MENSYNELLDNRESDSEGAAPPIGGESQEQASHGHHHSDVRQHEGHNSVSFLNDGGDSRIDHHHSNHLHHEPQESIHHYLGMHVEDSVMAAGQTHHTTEGGQSQETASPGPITVVAAAEGGGNRHVMTDSHHDLNVHNGDSSNVDVGTGGRSSDFYMPVPVGTTTAPMPAGVKARANGSDLVRGNTMAAFGEASDMTTATPAVPPPTLQDHHHQVGGGGVPHVFYHPYPQHTAQERHPSPEHMQQEQQQQEQQHHEQSPYTTHHHNHDTEPLPATAAALQQAPPLSTPTTSPTANTTIQTLPLHPTSPQHVDHLPLEIPPIVPAQVSLQQQQPQQQQVPPPMTTTPRHANSAQEILQARQKMNALLADQANCEQSIMEAKQALLEAQNRLSGLMNNKVQMDAAVVDGAKRYTDTLLMEHTHWNLMYRKLTDFRARNGHCDVKRTLLPREKRDNPEYVKLGSWVGRTRLEARRPIGHPERIEPYKIHALNRLGFQWQPRENDWMKNYENLKEYMAREGRGKMPTRRKDSLGVWCDGQINAYNKYKKGDAAYITQKKIDLLNEIGFVWDRNSNTWALRFQALKKFYKKHGHCRVPKDYQDTVVYRWVSKERTKYRNYVAGNKPCQTEEQWKMLKSIRLMDGKRVTTKKKKRKLNQSSESDTEMHLRFDNSSELRKGSDVERQANQTNNTEVPPPVTERHMMDDSIADTDTGPTGTVQVDKTNVERNKLVSNHPRYTAVVEGHVSLTSHIEL
jgi:hypothetical protein